MPDNFARHAKGLSDPADTPERSTHAADDFAFEQVTRAITCSADGTLVVDTPSTLGATIQVFKGWNPVRLVGITKAGSDTITVDGWS